MSAPFELRRGNSLTKLTCLARASTIISTRSVNRASALDIFSGDLNSEFVTQQLLAEALAELLELAGPASCLLLFWRTIKSHENWARLARYSMGAA